MGRSIVVWCLVALVSSEPTVEGPLGKITGKVDSILGTEIEAFLGIPYAKPPVGKLRFSLPQPFGPVGSLQADKHGAECPQQAIFSFGKSSEEEDCLYINVFRKSGTTNDSRKPVVAIIHGGGYIVGSSSDVHQSAEPLAGVGDVIVVSFNYRLGIFGFADMKEIAPGNLGLHDQRLALRWIRDHISDFGGDPKQVTVMGVSAGSMAVSAQIITIADKEDLFQAAVLDAGVVASHGFLEESESSFVRTQRVAEAVGCSKDSDKILECLRNIPAGALLSNSTTHPGSSALKNFRPTADGVFLPRDVERYVAEGSENLRKVRTIVGHAANEGTMFVNLVDPTFDFSTQRSKDDILDYCKKISIAYNFPFDASKEDTREKLERLYVDDNAGTAFKAISSLIADGWFKCPINTFIRDYSRHNSKVFAYRFVRELRKTYATFDPKILGAFHYSPYLHFSGALFMANDTVDGADKQFSLDAMKLISDFAASNRALVFRGVEWQNYLESGEVLIFNETPEVAKELSSERNCEELFPDRH